MYHFICEDCSSLHVCGNIPRKEDRKCYNCGGDCHQVIEGEYAQAKPLQLPATT